MKNPVCLHRRDHIGLLYIDNPPVNALSPAVFQALSETFDEFERDTSLTALIILGAGRTFVAGGDIAAFDSEDFSAAGLIEFLARLEASTRPVVAALHGTVLGGGLELALACHSRVSTLETKFGLPEVKLGLLPGAGGTQRLPRLVGGRVALDLITSGRTIRAAQALEAGLIDVIHDGEVLEIALARARELVEGRAPLRRTGDLSVPDAVESASAIANVIADAQQSPHLPAHTAIATCLQLALTRPLSEGIRFEAQEFERLRKSSQSRALRHLFFAEREASKVSGLPEGTAIRSIARVGVIGAGTMGTGIAMSFMNVGIPVLIVDAKPEALERGLHMVRSTYEASAAKGKITAADVERRMELLNGSLHDTALSDCDLVIEAVFEDMALKMDLCRRLGQLCKPGAIIATNTSTLDVNELAEASGRAEDVVGMHFFSPAHVMRLLEVVRGDKTAPDVLTTVMQLARRIGKTAVISGVCYGFIGNRMGEVYAREAEKLLIEGATPAQVDGAVESVGGIGLAMGPCRMLDMAGVDVGARTFIGWIKSGQGPSNPDYRAVCRTLFENGHHGQKSGLGYYRYEGRKPVDCENTIRICEELALQYGTKRRSDIDATEIVERLLYPMINEAARILEAGIAQRPGDIDVVWTAGYGFPAWRGGPMFMADEIGVAHIVERLDHYASISGNTDDWAVSPLLRRVVAHGGRLSDWRPAN